MYLVCMYVGSPNCVYDHQKNALHLPIISFFPVKCFKYSTNNPGDDPRLVISDYEKNSFKLN